MDVFFIHTEVESETLLPNNNRHFLSGDKEAVNRRHIFISFWSRVYGIFSSEAENNLQYQTLSRLWFFSDWQELTCMTGRNFCYFWKQKTKLVKIPKKTVRRYRGFLSSVSPDRQYHSCLQRKQKKIKKKNQKKKKGEERNSRKQMKYFFFVFHEWTLMHHTMAAQAEKNQRSRGALQQR